MRATSARHAVSVRACTAKSTAPIVRGNECVRRVRRVTTPKVPPPPPFNAKNSSGSRTALAMRTAPSAVTISASSRLAAPVPNCFDRLPKPPLWIKPATPTVRQPPP